MDIAPYSQRNDTIFFSAARIPVLIRPDSDTPNCLVSITTVGGPKDLLITPHIVSDPIAKALKYTRHYAQLVDLGIDYDGLNVMDNGQLISYVLHPDGTGIYSEATYNEIDQRLQLIDPLLLNIAFAGLLNAYFHNDHNQQSILEIATDLGISEEQSQIILEQTDDLTATVTSYAIWRLGDLLSFLFVIPEGEKLADPFITDTSMLLAGIKDPNDPTHFWHILNSLQRIQTNLANLVTTIKSLEL